MREQERTGRVSAREGAAAAAADGAGAAAAKSAAASTLNGWEKKIKVIAVSSELNRMELINKLI